MSAVADRDPAAFEIVSNAERLEIPVSVLGEYRFGIAQSHHRRTYEAWLRDILDAVTVLEIDEATTQCYAAAGLRLKRIGKPIPANDLWIAALCLQHSLPVVSRHRHFDLVPGVGTGSVFE